MEQPKNIFVQIMTGMKILNDNVVALADNLAVVKDMLSAMSAPLESEPTASGAATQSKKEQ